MQEDARRREGVHKLDPNSVVTGRAGHVHDGGENGVNDARGALWYAQSDAPEKLSV